MKKFFFLVFIVLCFSESFSQLSTPPKREFRSAWVATVQNLDWPPSGTPSTQKAALISIFDYLQSIGINVVIFQIRAECDAFYQSNYEPWSYYLTLAQGKAPNPVYDPLSFAVEEAHKRGMEIHAWFNPYRAVKTVGSYTVSSSHVTVQHPDWIITKGSYKFLNPGMQVVRNYVSTVIMDVVRRYDVDGIHMDDYFYPYEGMTNEDAATFASEPRGFTNVGDWRRDNVNILLRQLEDSVLAVKPFVKFGMSPFGIWKSGYPSGIIGLNAYSDIYCDAMAWLRMHSVDYLTPQLYWRIGGSQDYYKLANWWADSTFKYNRHLYPGHAPYRITDWSASELPNQIRIDRGNPKIGGSVFFRAGTMTGKGFDDSLATDLYRYKALLPVMTWKDSIAPNPVRNLKFDKISPTEPYALKWDLPLSAPDGDSAYRYVVYKFNTNAVTQNDLNDPLKISKIEMQRNSYPGAGSDSGPFFFVVTALDRNWNESGMSNIVEITAPQSPTQVFPTDVQINLTDTITFKWNGANYASSYMLQVSTDANFNSMIVNAGVRDTFYTMGGFEGQKTYYWRLLSMNVAGSSTYTNIYSFVTGFPVAPTLLIPAHAALNLPLTVDLKWMKDAVASTYWIQVSASSTFNSQTIFIDQKNLTDTTFSLSGLVNNTIYYWRVCAVNQFGTSLWSTKFGFRTTTASGLEYEETLPTEYSLAQNYPNPFNPETRIVFELPESGFTTLKIYDAVGTEVAELVNEDLPAGKFNLSFNASDLSSGVYFYILKSGDVMMSKKMILVK